MSALLWGAIGVMGALTSSLVVELVRVRRRRPPEPELPRSPAARPTRHIRRQDGPHDGWLT